MTDEIRHDYLDCVECSRKGAVRVLELFGQEIAFDRFNSDHTDMWAKDGGSWYCPNHAHIAMNMDREEFEELRDSEVEL